MLQLPTAQKAAPVAAFPSTPMVAFTILAMVVATLLLSSLVPAPERSKAASADKNTPTESIGKPTGPSGIRAQLSSGVSSTLREEALQAGVPREFIGRKPYLSEPILRSGNQQGHDPQLPKPVPDQR